MPALRQVASDSDLERRLLALSGRPVSLIGRELRVPTLRGPVTAERIQQRCHYPSDEVGEGELIGGDTGEARRGPGAAVGARSRTAASFMERGSVPGNHGVVSRRSG